ncbi:MAG: type II secretion system protein [Methylophilaceae bacterium]
MSIIKKIKGFTLIEIAIVLVIVGLLLSGLILPLTVQRDLRDYEETRRELSEYREALIGYALSNTPPYLPCPDAVGGDGLEEVRAGGVCPIDVGEVPWATLGLPESDSWNNTYLYRVTAAFSNSAGLTLTTVGGNTILDAAVISGGTSIANNIPAVIVSKGKNGIGAGDDEAENSDANSFFVSHEQIDVAASAFDDVVVWVPATILFNRMVTAGKLP